MLKNKSVYSQTVCSEVNEGLFYFKKEEHFIVGSKRYIKRRSYFGEDSSEVADVSIIDKNSGTVLASCLENCSYDSNEIQYGSESYQCIFDERYNLVSEAIENEDAEVLELILSNIKNIEDMRSKNFVLIGIGDCQESVEFVKGDSEDDFDDLITLVRTTEIFKFKTFSENGLMFYGLVGTSYEEEKASFSFLAEYDDTAPLNVGSFGEFIKVS